VDEGRRRVLLIAASILAAHIPAPSPDGKQAAVERRDPQSGKWSIWLFDFARGTSARFTFGSATAQHPIWSPDGKRVIFASDPNGVLDLYQKEANGAKAEELLLKSSEGKGPGSVSPDGRFLMYAANNPKTKLDLWVLPLQSSEKPFVFLQTEFNEGDGHFSANGHLVAYRSDESGHWEIYVRPFVPDSAATQSAIGGKWQISNGGGIRPWWSPDGKELYYLTPDGKVMVVPVSTGPTFQSRSSQISLPGAARSNSGRLHRRRKALFVSNSNSSSGADAVHRRSKLASGTEEIGPVELTTIHKRREKLA
jgi:eukaryotic-like serine/threonine-protein kinase